MKLIPKIVQPLCQEEVRRLLRRPSMQEGFSAEVSDIDQSDDCKSNKELSTFDVEETHLHKP